MSPIRAPKQEAVACHTIARLSNVNVVADGVLLNGDTGLLGSVPDELDRFDHLQLLTNFNSRSIAGYGMAIAPSHNLVLYRR